MAKIIVCNQNDKAMKQFYFSFDMLTYCIDKYRENDVEEVVYRLSFAGKYIIVKGKTLAGSLIIISEGLDHYRKDTTNPRFKTHIHLKFYDHLLSHAVGRFRLKILYSKDNDANRYYLLKREQIELDKATHDPNCLNTSFEAYIPKYRPETGNYGWIEKTHVMNLKKYLASKQRQSLMLAMSGLSS